MFKISWQENKQNGLLTSDISGVSSFDEKLLLHKLKLYEIVEIDEFTQL